MRSTDTSRPRGQALRDPESERAPNPSSETGAEPRHESESDFEPRPESDTRFEARLETDRDPRPETDPDPRPETDRDPRPETDRDRARVSQDWRAAYRDRTPLRTLRGRVSYYHDSLAGNPTASGPVYDPRAFTCASRDLPFGTVIRVIREETGRSTIVRVNDRGPFGRARRLLDLSRAAAEELDMIARGVVDVRAEILELPSERGRRR